MKRANLQLLLASLFLCAGNLFSQNFATNFIQRNFTLSDFGDGVDAAGSVVWKPRFSDTVVQVKEEGQQQNGQQAQAGQNGQNQETAIKKSNPDTARSAVRYVEEVPMGVTLDSAEPQKYVLGVKAQYTVQGYNWIELTPQRLKSAADQDQQAQQNGQAQNQQQNAQGQQQNGQAGAAPDPAAETVPYRIPFTGKAVDLTLWAWGGQYAWWVEVYLRDFENYQYRFNLGDLLYTGWRQKRATVPSSVVQTRKRLPSSTPLTFEMIKLWSFPTESVDMFYAYFDLLQTSVIVPSDVFNGEKLANDLW